MPYAVLKKCKEEIMSSDKGKFNLIGGAFGYAFSAQMLGANPSLSPDAKLAYQWAEQGFLRIAREEISENEATLGYGG